jgi:DNA-nicking Smr family endonuclease
MVEPARALSPPPLGVGGQPPGVDTASWQRFRRGQLASVRKLDLHGLTAQQAYHALRTFLRAAHADRVRCVEIVTGRGNGEHGGVLRREFALWLNLPDIRPLVLAAVHPHTSSAMHSHMANPGSVRLLLRRPRG